MIQAIAIPIDRNIVEQPMASKKEDSKKFLPKKL